MRPPKFFDEIRSKSRQQCFHLFAPKALIKLQDLHIGATPRLSCAGFPRRRQVFVGR